MKKICDFLNCAVFFGMLAIFCVFSFMLPKKEFSEAENRYLATVPSFSADDYFSGGYADDLSEYLDDRFPMRENWISLHTRLEILQGRREINGVYVSDERLLELHPKIDLSQLDERLSVISRLGEGGIPVYFVLAPNSAAVYSSMLPESVEVLNQRELINYAYEAVSENVRTVDVYSRLYANRESYIYYRTDHHWTSQGAYIAYCDVTRAMGLSPAGREKFNIMHANHNFWGSLHSKVLTKNSEADTIDFYISNQNSVRLTTTDSAADGVPFVKEYLGKKDKYLSYLGKNTAIVSLDSTASGGRLLVIKDSYANCFLPFMSEHYSHIDAVDLRYMTDPREYINISDYDAILILYNAAGFADDANLIKLKLLEN